jgi:hypothetical protein
MTEFQLKREASRSPVRSHRNGGRSAQAMLQDNESGPRHTTDHASNKTSMLDKF